MREEGNARNEAEIYYGVGSFIFELIKVFFLAVVIIVPIRLFLFQPFFVKGASMEPTFSEGDYLIINEWGYKKTEIGFFGFDTGISVNPFREVERLAVVVVRSPDSIRNGATYFIKRVIGLPGETVIIEDGHVKIINKNSPKGFVLDESAYLNASVKTIGTGLTLGEDEYFIMGDNRGNSSDSRSWGALKKDHMVGTVFLRVFPLSGLHTFSSNGV